MGANAEEVVKAMKEKVEEVLGRPVEEILKEIEYLTTELTKLGELCDKDEVQWDALMRTKIGKQIGIIQKAEWSDENLKTLATKLIKKFREMAERNRPLWS